MGWEGGSGKTKNAVFEFTEVDFVTGRLGYRLAWLQVSAKVKV